MNLKKIYPAYMMVVPLIVFSVFFLLPSTIGYLYAFTDWNPYVDKISFVGFENFKEIAFNKTLLIAAENTIGFAVVKTVAVTVIGIALALILNTKIKTRNVLRTIFFLPSVFSALVIGLIFAGLFDASNGIINITLTNLGLENWTQEWLGKKNACISNNQFSRNLEIFRL